MVSNDFECLSPFEIACNLRRMYVAEFVKEEGSQGI